MTRRRIFANPLYSIPLTKAGQAKKDGKELAASTPSSHLIVCKDCGKAGGTLVKVGDNEYSHADDRFCKR
jgi:hypothetical protein